MYQVIGKIFCTQWRNMFLADSFQLKRLKTDNYCTCLYYKDAGVPALCWPLLRGPVRHLFNGATSIFFNCAGKFTWRWGQ